MKVHVKSSTGDKVTLEVSASITVGEFKAELEQKLGIPVDQQRLIYAGRVMKDPTTLESNAVKDDHTVHLVRGASNNTSSQTYTHGSPASPTHPGSVPTPQPAPSFPSPFGGTGLPPNFAQLAGNENFMRDMMNNPLVQSMLSNPELMRNLIMSQPQMREVLERNPEIGHVLNNPETLRQTMEMMRNPELMREMMRNTDRAMVNIENHPEGFNMLRRMYETVQEPLLNSAAQANPFASLFAPPTNAANANAAPSVQPIAPNTAPLPNPWGTSSAPSTTPSTSTTSAPGTSAPSSTTPATPFGFPGLGGFGLDPNSMQAMFENPAIQGMMQQVLSNPEFMQQMMGNNPLLQQAMATNPALRNMLSNPELLRQLSNPQNLQAMMQMQSAMQQLQRSGLFPDMSQMMFPGMTPMTPTAAGPTPGGGSGGTTTPAGAPFDMSQMMSMLMGGGVGGGGGGFGGLASPGGVGATTPASTVAPEEQYRVQLQQLAEMGFTNVQDNIAALQATGGSVQLAIERLFSQPR